MKELRQQVISGRYVLQRLLGSGISGQVFLARDTELPNEPLVA